MTVNSLNSQDIFAAGFAEVGTSVLDQFFAQPAFTSGGTTFNQASGSLNIVAPTAANAEFLARSVIPFSGSMRLRHAFIASQRIAGNNFAVLLADLLGERLAYTATSATNVNITLVNHGLTARNVGQFIFLGALNGPGGVPGRYAIAGVIGPDQFSVTVSGFTVGSGTLTAFGRNWVRTLFNGTTATAAAADSQRDGWAVGDTTLTINTTASPGTVMSTELAGRDIFWQDSLRASSTTPTFTTRASRYENIPDANTQLYVFLWSFNSAAAASATTWTLSHLALENFPNNPVYIQGFRSNGGANRIPVDVSQSALAAGTNAIGDVGVQYRANATGAGTPTIINSPATPAVQTIKGSAGRLLAVSLVNTGAAARFFKVYNATAPTLGTTAAAIDVCLPVNVPVTVNLEGGVGFATAITCAVTGARGATDNTAITGNEVTGFTVHA